MKTCYLLGYPVEHSLSAEMQNAAFRALDLDYRYELLSVRPERLEVTVEKLRDVGVRGANVTIPHKVPVMESLDALSEEAAAIRAINTIVNEGGRLIGHNTDGGAAIRALEEAHGPLRGASVVVIGAGGAARALGYHLSRVVDELTIINRTLERAEALAVHLRDLPGCEATITASTLTRDDVESELEHANILVNATPVGMTPHADESPIDGGLLRPGLTVFDLVYNPLRTRLLSDAESASAKTLSGLRMLAYQGAAAFELWTGVDAPEELMIEVLEKRLGGGSR
ncbi:MAG TPA: shikimate dehydrogenase [Patescibacteria group bacterium]|nr:shikimate dehydrogenase [Patescibacteria group bacterium]